MADSRTGDNSDEEPMLNPAAATATEPVPEVSPDMEADGVRAADQQ